MISGATRGRGSGDALAKHLLKAENDVVTVIPARGLGSADLVGQLRELVAQSVGGRTDRPVYHLHLDPDPGIADEAAARALWWSLFEKEFGLAGQPYCGVEHQKAGRRHEHRVYSLVRPSGAVVDLAWDYPRREKCSRIVEQRFGMRPVASRHARSIERRLRQEGRTGTADWLARSGATSAERPVAPLTPTERLQQERTGVPLSDVRRAALAAWRAGEDGATFIAALRARGLDLRQGRRGPVVVDAAGGAHLAARVIGAAARELEGERITAATVRARLAGMTLEDLEHERIRDHAASGRPGPLAARDRVCAGPGIGWVGGDRPLRFGGGAGRHDGGRGGCDLRRPRVALGRLRSLPPGRRMILRRRLFSLDPSVDAYLAAAERARAAVSRMEEESLYERDRAWALWGRTDIWGIPLL
ncbi:hypothetical protein MKK65_10605 [Methylobacterium sp. J-001]|uniref:relaxase/mobilization nuclease domain-containing protein n=1 Tax=Methylobacterium sp. J-001 TaxID=2836609 RepID=UPI001FBB78EC|nr:hypothetical protein [Methylobacterium sp. J-001]MCJ2117014.1 hypothetical protein [Methylobacterium sp. J-001]